MKILVVAGSSGGHIFPALALIEHLKADYPQVETRLVLPGRNSGSDIERKGIKTAYIDSATPKFSLDKDNLNTAYKFLKGFWQSFLIFLRFKPDVVVGFGSIASIPLVFLGWLGRIKVVLHEQNVIPGQANRFLIRICDRMAVSFEKTRDQLKPFSDKIVFTGNPLRKALIRVDRAKCLEFFALEEKRITVLVMGGSQGSSRVNQGILKALSVLPEKDRLQVIHLSGPADQEKLTREYSRLPVKSRVFSFLNEMEYALSLADLAVCRAGATSIQELVHYRLPAILLPYPFAHQHQMANARVLEEPGCAAVVEDSDLDSDKLKDVLSLMISDPRRLAGMRQGYGVFKTNNPAKELADLIMDPNHGH